MRAKQIISKQMLELVFIYSAVLAFVFVEEKCGSPTGAFLNSLEAEGRLIRGLSFQTPISSKRNTLEQSVCHVDRSILLYFT
jgi:hypothetical protein